VGKGELSLRFGIDFIFFKRRLAPAIGDQFPGIFLFKKPAFDLNWLFYYEHRSFAAFNNTDKII